MSCSLSSHDTALGNVPSPDKPRHPSGGGGNNKEDGELLLVSQLPAGRALDIGHLSAPSIGIGLYPKRLLEYNPMHVYSEVNTLVLNRAYPQVSRYRIVA